MLFKPNFHIPIIGRWDALGFTAGLLRARACCLGITTFAIIRLRSEPKEYGRQSRFYGSHTGGAWLILFMIFNVIWTYAMFRGSSVNNGNLPYGCGAFFSHAMGAADAPAGCNRQRDPRDLRAAAAHRRDAGLPDHRAALQAPAHLPGADQRDSSSGCPTAWVRCCRSSPTASRSTSKIPPRTRRFGRGKIEDFTWKGMLDFATCTECGRCQSQCPAWNTGSRCRPSS